jgi:hypothetical protein
MKKAARKKEFVAETPYPDARFKTKEFKRQFVKNLDAYLADPNRSASQFFELYDNVYKMCTSDEWKFAYTHLVSKIDEADIDDKRCLVRIGTYLDRFWVKDMKKIGEVVVMPDGTERKVEYLKDLIN